MRLKVDPGDGGGGDGIGCAGEWGLGTIVENIEAADTVVKVVVGEKLRKIYGLVLDCDVRLALHSVDFDTRLEDTDLPYKLPYTLHNPEAEALGMVLVQRCSLSNS